MIGRYGDGLALGPYAGINPTKDNVVRWKVPERGQPHLGRMPHVFWMNGVRDVDQVRGWAVR